MTPKFRELAVKAARLELVETPDRKHKRDVWEEMGEDLEYAGVARTRISTEIRREIENALRTMGRRGQLNSGYFFSIMNKNGWTDPKFDRTSKPLNKEPETATVQEHEELAYKVVPSREADRLNLKEQKKNTDMGKMLTACRSIRESIKSLEHAMRTNPKMMDFSGYAGIEEYVRDVEAIAKSVAETANMRTNTPPSSHAVVKEIMQSEIGMLRLGRAVMAIRMGIIEDMHQFISASQRIKFAKGMESNQLPMYTPKERDSAIFLGFWGVPCKKCKSYRVIQDPKATRYESVVCVDCDYKWSQYTVLQCAGFNGCGLVYYSDVIAKIKSTKRCPGCQKPVKLPPHLLL